MIALLLAAALAQAPALPPAPARVSKLKWRPAVDLPVTAVLGAGWLVSEYAVKNQLAPARCRWCSGNSLDESFRSLFQPKVDREGASLADDASNVAFVSGAFITLGIQAVLAARDGALREFPIDALIVLEAVFAAQALNQTVKFLVARERPFVHQLAETEKPLTHAPPDNNLAFYSGHATFTMSLAVAAGTVTALRGYRQGFLVWAFAVPLSLTTGMLRIAADKHSFSDVLVGWLVGAGIGFAIPWFFHGVEDPLAVRLVPGPGGIALAGRF